MSVEAHHRLLAELNAGRFDSPQASAAIAQLGVQGRLLRGLAWARRRAWASARAELLRAVDGPEAPTPRTAYVVGTGLIVARDYHAGATWLRAAASSSTPAVARYASKVAAKLALELGWIVEAQPLLEQAAARAPASDLRARTAELRRRSAIQRRAAEVQLGSDAQVASKAWRLVLVDGIPAARHAFEGLLARRGPAPALVLARARVELLAGELGTAREWLERAPAELGRVERAALALASGAAGEALALVGAERSPTAAYLRGEALLAREDYAGAAELLERARAAMPSSVVIALSLALARYHEDPDGPATEFEHRFVDLVERAPTLLSDAASLLGVPLWTDTGLLASRSEAARVLSQARALLTAERELERAHYRRSPDGPIRQIPPTAPAGPSALARLHAHDLDWVDKLHSTLIAGAGVDPVGPRGPSRARAASSARPQWLSAAEIEQFLADGYLRIPRAVDVELARRWREGANRRIRAEPERWIKGYDPDDPRRSLRGYSPSDPATWTWERVVLDGDEELAIEELAPRAWRAVCDLLGGADRIATRTWSNYMNINFCCAQGQLVDGVPAPDGIGWHIDDPHPAMRVDRIRNGLVGIVLFDDLLPASGNTWVCPDSVPRIARELAAHPEGIDFVHDRGARITAQCERFVEIVGDCGDVFLLHPLLMHTASPNRSGRIRWMGNPMVYMQAPLDPLRADRSALSPVELAIRQAIDER